MSSGHDNFFYCREVNKGDNKEAVFTGLFPGGLYSVTIVTVVGTNPEVVSASSQASFRISEYHITLIPNSKY